MDELKRGAALRAMELVQSGMRLGLGTGSTAAFFVQALGESLKSGKLVDIAGVPTSIQTVDLARRYGIPMISLSEVEELDMVVDGADEVDPRLNLIKGLGGALLREKMVASHTDRLVILVDESKLVERLGQKAPLPVEVVQFEWQAQLRWLRGLGCLPELRRQPDGEPFITDNGNYIIHCRFPEGIPEPETVSRALNTRAGVVEHGLFLGMASLVVIAGRDGVSLRERKS